MIWRAYSVNGMLELRGNEEKSSLTERAIEILPGQYFDAETGLHQNRFRDYDPSTGRYLQPDPIGLAGGISMYGYVGANPLGRTDSNGLSDDTGIPSNLIPFIPAVLGLREPDTVAPPPSLERAPQEFADQAGSTAAAFLSDALLPAVAFSPAGLLLEAPALGAMATETKACALAIEKPARLAWALWEGTLGPFMRVKPDLSLVWRVSEQTAPAAEIKAIQGLLKEQIKRKPAVPPPTLPVATQPKR